MKKTAKTKKKKEVVELTPHELAQVASACRTVRACAAEIGKADAKSLKKRTEAGQALAQIKDAVGHGNFTSWMRTHSRELGGVSIRQLQRWLLLAEFKSAIDQAECRTPEEAYRHIAPLVRERREARRAAKNGKAKGKKAKPATAAIDPAPEAVHAAPATAVHYTPRTSKTGERSLSLQLPRGVTWRAREVEVVAVRPGERPDLSHLAPGQAVVVVRSDDVTDSRPAPTPPTPASPVTGVGLDLASPDLDDSRLRG